MDLTISKDQYIKDWILKSKIGQIFTTLSDNIDLLALFKNASKWSFTPFDESYYVKELDQYVRIDPRNYAELILTIIDKKIKVTLSKFIKSYNYNFFTYVILTNNNNALDKVTSILKTLYKKVQSKYVKGDGKYVVITDIVSNNITEYRSIYEYILSNCKVKYPEIYRDISKIDNITNLGFIEIPQYLESNVESKTDLCKLLLNIGEADSINLFMENIVIDKNSNETFASLYKIYTAYCKNNGLVIKNTNLFRKKISATGHKYRYVFKPIEKPKLPGIESMQLYTTKGYTIF